MEMLEGLLYGMSVVLTPEYLLAAFIGVAAGTAVGVLPGLGPVAGAALVLPLTLTLDPVTGVIVIAGIYYGAMYGGSTTSVLLRVPGETASIVATFDGYQLSQRGRPGPVLAIMAVGSFVAGTLAVALVTLFTPVLSRFGLMFGPAEFFALTAGGLLAFSRLTGGTLMTNLFPLFVGVILGTVGREGVTGISRFTFGSIELGQGISLVPVAVGLFGIAEMMFLAERIRDARKVTRVRVRDLAPSREEWRRSVPAWLRGSAVGFGFGLLPGPSATMSSFASYRLEQGVSRHRREIGKGAIEGVAGPEASNNAASTSSMVPVLALGIPFSATLALMLSAMIVQGVQPGPLLMTQHPEIFWGVIASMYLGNVMLMFLNLPLIGVWVSTLRIPQHVLIPAIVVFATVGAYSVSNSMLNVYALVAMGVVGYILRKLDFNLAPMVLGVVLGPLAEKHLLEGLFLSGGNPAYFIGTPIAIGLWAAIALLLLGVPIARRMQRRWRISRVRSSWPHHTRAADEPDNEMTASDRREQ